MAKIPERRVFYSPDEKRRWSAMWKAWLKSDRKDESVWQEFRVLLTTPGFRFYGDEGSAESGWTGGRFAESVVALELLGNGYTCSHACRLFRYGKKSGVWLEPTKDLETLLVEADLPLPEHFRKRIQPRPQNPDLAACLGKKWHFCEVKFNLREQVDKGQLVALAVLRQLVGATVEVVRVVEEQYRELKARAPYECDYTIT